MAMKKIRDKAPRSAGTPEVHVPSDELAWRVHENAKGWITQVDIKAAASLAIEAAILGFAFALVTNSDSLAQLTMLSRVVVSVGLLLLLISVILSILVLLPRIKLNEPEPEDRGYLYFGHLRHWDKRKLSAALARNRVDDDELAGQVIKMSEIAWRKHIALRWSLYFLLVGIVVVGGIYLLFVLGWLPEAIGHLAAPANSVGGMHVPD